MAKRKSEKVPMVKLSAFKPNGRNPRKISAAAFERLCKSIKRDPKFLELRPIVADENNVVWGGNQRFKALQALGRKEVPVTWVMVRTDLTEQQKKRFALIDNAPEGAAGYWDYEAGGCNDNHKGVQWRRG